MLSMVNLMVASAETIRALRRRLGLTQAELARQLDTDPGTVSRWERGVTQPRATYRTRIAALLGETDAASLEELVRLVGVDAAKRALRRLVLLRWQPTPVSIQHDAEARLRELDRVRREQLQMKADLGVRR